MTDYGRDTYCLDSLRTGKFASGATLIGQRLYHALTTPRGALLGGEEAQNWGEDVEGLIGTPAGPNTESKIRAKVDRAASKDETIASITTAIVSSVDAAGDTSHEVTIDAKTAAGPFQLVLSIGSVTVDLLGLTVPT